VNAALVRLFRQTDGRTPSVVLTSMTTTGKLGTFAGYRRAAAHTHTHTASSHSTDCTGQWPSVTQHTANTPNNGKPLSSHRPSVRTQKLTCTPRRNCENTTTRIIVLQNHRPTTCFSETDPHKLNRYNSPAFIRACT